MGRSDDNGKRRSTLKGCRARLVIVLLGLSPFLILEITLRVIGYGRDPFKNFAPDARIFQAEGRLVVVRADYRLIFPTRPFLPKKPPGSIRVFAIGDSV